MMILMKLMMRMVPVERGGLGAIYACSYFCLCGDTKAFVVIVGTIKQLCKLTLCRFTILEELLGV
jgi:hypothetical protein